MTQQSRPSFELLLGEVSLKAPETPLYLGLAARVLEARRLELEDGSSPDLGPVPPAPPPPSPAVATMDAPPAESTATEAVAAPVTTAEAIAMAEPVTVVQEPAEAEETPVLSSAPAPAAVEETAAAPDAEEAPVETAVQEQPVTMLPTPPEPAASAAPARRARWFRGQLPVVNYEDGTSQVMESLDALKDLLRSRGLTPHPRGDASMLLWQVRNRLGLSVDQVDA